MNDSVQSQQAREPMATRQLTWDSGSGEHDILVSLWQPVAFDGLFVCDFAIDGLDEPARSEATEVDSLEALAQGLNAIRYALAPHREKLSWLGQPGEHGVPYYVINVFDPNEQRRLERLVESEIERYLEVYLEPLNRWEASLREQYDPNSKDIDFSQVPTEELVERLRATSARHCAYRAEGNDDGAFVFGLNRHPIIAELRKRPEYVAILRDLTCGNDRALCLLAAELLDPTDTPTLERLRDDKVQPEASAAEKQLNYMRRSATRPKPWDEPNPPMT